MKINKIVQLGSAFALSLSSLLAISLGVVHASGNNCLWNGSVDETFNTAANWSNCGSVTPGTGDSVIFDNTTIPSSGSVLNDNLSSVTLANITFQGTGSNTYDITSTNAIPISGNISDTSTVGGNTIDAPITFTAPSTVSSTNGLYLGTSNNYTMNIGTNTVTFSGTGEIFNNDAIAGSGTVDIDMTGTSDPNNAYEQMEASPSFTGPLNLEAGVLKDYSSNQSSYPDLFSGSSGITVSSGATLYFDGDVNSSGTVAENITAGGDGNGTCETLFGIVVSIAVL
jgi:hypothetical protein